MKTGDIILIPFPFSDLTSRKARPCVVVCETADVHNDITVCAISSVVPIILNSSEILLNPSTVNGLRTISVLKVDRIVTVQAINVIANLGKLSSKNLLIFKTKFKGLVD
jgi:mRNA interferase MazF